MYPVSAQASVPSPSGGQAVQGQHRSQGKGGNRTGESLVCSPAEIRAPQGGREGKR